MKKVFVTLMVVFTFALAACGTSAAPTALPTVSLDSAAQPASSSGGKVSAAAQVVPATNLELAFPLAGLVETVNVKEGDTVKAGDILAALDTAILEAKVRDAEAVVVIEQTQVAYLKRTRTDNERLLAAQADVERAQAAVDIAKAQLAQATLTAPIDGVIAAVNISPAEYAAPGQTVVIMGDLTHFQIETTDFSEKDVPKVKIGQKAVVYIEALDAEFTSKVADIARISQTVGGDIVFKITIALDEQPAGLRWGMSADVEIETE